MRYADQPDRFMDSEADLDEAVKALLVVASAPDLYPELVQRWGRVGRGFRNKHGAMASGGEQGRARVQGTAGRNRETAALDAALPPLPRPTPCSTSAVPTLLALLNHENSDIAADAVEVLSELTDADAVEDAVRRRGSAAAGASWMLRLRGPHRWHGRLLWAVLGQQLAAGGADGWHARLTVCLGLGAPPPICRRRRHGCWWTRCLRTMR